MNSDIILVYVSTSSYTEATSIAKELVEQELCACVSIIPTVRSIYKYKGVLHNEDESILLIKSKSSLFSKIEEVIIKLHSYETPEIIATKIVKGHEKYVDWIHKVVKE